MELVFISGWATTASVWNKIDTAGFHTSFLNWNKVITGDFELPPESILCGWSLGGQLAMELSARSEVKGIVLVSSMSCLAKSPLRPGVDSMIKSEIQTMLSKSRTGYLSSFFRECGADDEKLPHLLQGAASFSIHDLNAGLETMFRKVAIPADDKPVTLVHGTGDRIIPFSCSQYVFDKLLEGKGTFIRISGGNHLLPLSRPEIITEAVKQLAERTDT